MEINRKIGGNKYKQCPNCYIIIEKDEGCNHMTCINCQFEFCWLCLKKYTEDHYAIYNLIGCPGMKYGTKLNIHLKKTLFKLKTFS
jgi:hypothetical protein